MSNILYYLKTKGLAFVIRETFSRCFFNIIKFKYTGNELADVIVMESHNDFDCNCGAFYDFLIAQGLNDKYKIVWLVKNKVNRELPHNVFAFNIDKLSFMKNYYLCRAKYILYEDRTVQRVWDEQIIVYCTHGGITFKNVKGHLKVSDDVSFVLSPSLNYDPLMCENYSIPYPNDKMIHLGYPSNDVLFQDNMDEIRKIADASYNKIILWMPTFRKSKSGRNDSGDDTPFGIPLIKSIDELLNVDRFLTQRKSLLIVKFHPMQDMKQVVIPDDLENIKFLDAQSTKEYGIDVYRLMACVDAMIGDYSSAAYSYLLLNRPIAFVLSDLDNYKPGLTYNNINDMDVLPGHKIYTYDDLRDFLKNVLDGNDKYALKRKKLVEWLYDDVDGNACLRLLNFLGLIR